MLVEKMESSKGPRPLQVVRDVEMKPAKGLNEHQLEIMRDTYRHNGIRIFETMEAQRSTRINR